MLRRHTSVKGTSALMSYNDETYMPQWEILQTYSLTLQSRRLSLISRDIRQLAGSVAVNVAVIARYTRLETARSGTQDAFSLTPRTRNCAKAHTIIVLCAIVPRLNSDAQ